MASLMLFYCSQPIASVPSRPWSCLPVLSRKIEHLHTFIYIIPRFRFVSLYSMFLCLPLIFVSALFSPVILVDSLLEWLLVFIVFIRTISAAQVFFSFLLVPREADLGPMNSRPSFRPFGTHFSQNLRIRIFWFFAWSQVRPKEQKWRFWIFEKNS